MTFGYTAINHYIFGVGTISPISMELHLMSDKIGNTVEWDELLSRLKVQVFWFCQLTAKFAQVNHEPFSSLISFALFHLGKDSISGDKAYSHLSNKRDVTLTDFGKFHPAQNKNAPCSWFHYKTFNILTEANEDFSHGYFEL